MKKKIVFAIITTGLLFMAPSLTFSQDERGTQKNANASTKSLIETVVPNLAHQSISVTFSSLDMKNDYRVLLFNEEGDLMNSYWVDGKEMTLFVGPISPGNYELVLMRDKTTVDRREIVLE